MHRRCLVVSGLFALACGSPLVDVGTTETSSASEHDASDERGVTATRTATSADDTGAALDLGSGPASEPISRLESRRRPCRVRRAR